MSRRHPPPDRRNHTAPHPDGDTVLRPGQKRTADLLNPTARTEPGEEAAGGRT